MGYTKLLVSTNKTGCLPIFVVLDPPVLDMIMFSHTSLFYFATAD